MILPAIFLAFATACTPDGIDEEQPESTPCEAGFILDGSSCVPESCGTGRWGSLAVDDDTVYVDGTAGEGGDGTEEMPYTTIQRGLNRAGTLGGGLVAVAAGTYPETLELTTDHADVHLAGRCREMVILDASVGDEETPGIGIDAGYGAVEVEGVTVRNSSYVGLWVLSGEVLARDAAILDNEHWGVGVYQSGLSGGPDLAMEGCLISDNTELGLFAFGPGTEVSLVDTTVMDTQEDANGSGGWGIEILEGATLSVEGCLIVGNTAMGLIASSPGTHVTLRDTTVTDTQPNAHGTNGRGIEVNDGAVLSAKGCLIGGSSEIGMIATGAGTHAALQDTIIESTRPDSNGATGTGIEANDGAAITMDGCLIEGNTNVGIREANPDTRVSLRDTTVRNTLPDTDGKNGRGIEAGDGAALTMDDCYIEGNTGVGLLAVDVGTRIYLRDTTVRDTNPEEDGEFGRGIEVHDGAMLSADGCIVDGNSEHGVLAGGAETIVTLRATVVRDTKSNVGGEFRGGIEAFDGVHLFAEGCLIEGNAETGILAFGLGTEVVLHETTVRGSQPDPNGDLGRGIEVCDHASLSIKDCLIEGNAEVGLFAFSPGTQVTLRDTTLRDTKPNANGESGLGIGVLDGATLSADGCLITGNTDIGLAASDHGTRVTLRNTTVEDTIPNNDAVSGRGIEVQDSATLAAVGCLIERNTEIGLNVSGPDTRVTLANTTVKDTQSNSNGEYGRGIGILDGASLTAEGCLIDGNVELGLFASDPGTQVTLWDSTISNTRSASDLVASCASGLTAQMGASMSATRLAVLSSQGPGLLVNSEGTMNCMECTVQGSQFAGAAVVQGGTLSIADSIIEGTTPSVNLLGGVGVYAWPWVGDPPTVTVTNTLIQDNPIAGVWLIGDGTYVLDGNTISGGIGEPFGSGERCGDAILALDGVTAWDGSSGLLLQDNLFQNAEGAGIFLDDSSAMMSGNLYSGNAIDLVVQNQSCDSIPDYSEAPQRDLCPIYSYPTCYAEFFFVAVPAEPVDWEEDNAAPRPVPLPPMARKSLPLAQHALMDPLPVSPLRLSSHRP